MAEKETLFIAVTNQKGGVGKLVITTLLSSYFYFLRNKRPVIIDRDYPQHSIYNMREDDKKTVSQNEELQQALGRQFKLQNKKAYPVIKNNLEIVLEEATRIIETAKETPDIIFFDLPGTVNNTGIINLILNMNYLFWNKVDKREHTELYKDFNAIMMEQQMHLLRSELPDTKKYNKELSPTRSHIFRSTLFPLDKKMIRNSNIDKLAWEILHVIKI